MKRRNLNDDNVEVFERYVVPTLKVIAVIMILGVAALVLFVK
jgi:hypothetical protein